MFYCGKMLIDGNGIEKNEQSGIKYLELAKKNGCNERYTPKNKIKKKEKKKLRKRRRRKKRKKKFLFRKKL